MFVTLHRSQELVSMVILVHGMVAISRGLPARRVVSLKIQIPLGTRCRGDVGQVGHQVVLIVRPGVKLVLEMMDAGARSDLMVPLSSPVSGSTTEYILELLAASTASLQRVASRSCRARSGGGRSRPSRSPIPEPMLVLGPNVLSQSG